MTERFQLSLSLGCTLCLILIQAESQISLQVEDPLFPLFSISQMKEKERNNNESLLLS